MHTSQLVSWDIPVINKSISNLLTDVVEKGNKGQNINAIDYLVPT